VAKLTGKSVSKELRPAYRAALRAGWRAEDGGGHVKLFPPDGGRPVMFPRAQKTNSGTVRHIQKAVRRAGVEF
jgi:hypothetical protein